MLIYGFKFFFEWLQQLTGHDWVINPTNRLVWTKSFFYSERKLSAIYIFLMQMIRPFPEDILQASLKSVAGNEKLVSQYCMGRVG